MSAALAARLREIADAWLGEPEREEAYAAAAELDRLAALARAEAERDAAQSLASRETESYQAARAELDREIQACHTMTLRCHRAEAVADAARALANFGLACLRESREQLGDLDGGWVQEKATELGALTPVEVTEPCCPENCVCAEYGFPTTCYRDSEATKAYAAAVGKT